MSSITKLPCEVIVLVLRDLGNMRSLLPCLLTCRYFYSCFRENPGVAADILRQQVTPALIPYSIAALEASRLNPRTGAAVQELLETLYTEPSKLADRLRTMSVPLLAKMGNMHEATHSLATTFANSSWTCLSNDQGSRISGSLSLSSAEYFRFCRAFYRVELYFCLFRTSTPSTAAELLDGSDKERFLSKHAPWENEQLGCALEFLERQLSEASHDVLAHDVELGELGIDYLTAGDGNGWRQLWLSQGIGFIYRLINENSYETKKALLKSTFGAGSADLYEALCTPSEEGLDDVIPLAEYTDEALTTLFPVLDSQDTDKGPFEAWRVAFNVWPRCAWVMLVNSFGLRKRAYVFWDWDRLERYGMLELSDNVPEGSELQYTGEEYDAMYESFKERSNIWQKGGSGYWSRGDESKIVWRHR
ncbi:hypothetical protein GGS23DRAFT_596457 [Durotheca rogersii]|uniref:uncharacterized protein n=1 Tax=Durotheca rogersii TaxID=419775 RepID=UPI00222001FA|nr:uncharacterized protein GGS23DRAFT_596457 [Durotheca rogersii]KAI5863973.1 hypothetical protein GGS23DRAFT_596457 [Durotheca rogersii]